MACREHQPVIIATKRQTTTVCAKCGAWVRVKRVSVRQRFVEVAL